MAIGNGATATLTLSGVDYHSGTSNQTYTANTIAITGADATFTTASGGGNISFADGGTGEIDIDDDVQATATGGLLIRTNGNNIDIEAELTGETGDNGGGAGLHHIDIALNAGGGTIVLDSPSTGSGVINNDIGEVTLTGATITISDDIVTDGEDINIAGALVLNATGAVLEISSGTGAGNIDFSSTINATGDSDEGFTVNSGTGTVVIDSHIGGTTAIHDLKINNAAGSGAITLSGNVGASATADGAAAVAIGNNDTASITFGGVEFTTLETQLFTADDYNINGADSTFGSDNNNITFADGGATDISIDLGAGANLFINTEVGGTGTGNIAVNAAIKRIAAGDGDDALDITLDAGSGTLSVEAINTGINDVALTGATITLNDDITTAADSDDTGASGTTGAVTITGAALLETVADIAIDTSASNGAVSFTSTVNSDANKTLTITSGSGAVDFAGVIGGVAGDHLTGLSINAQGSSTGTGTIDILQIGDTTGPEHGVVGVVTIGNTATADVTFDGAEYLVDGALTVTSTTGEKILFTGAAATTVQTAQDSIAFNTGTIQLAASTPLTINSAGGAIAIKSVMSAGTTADNDVTINANSDGLAGGDNDGDNTITSETITIGAVGAVSDIGKLKLDAADGVTLTGNITLADAAAADLDVNSKAFISGDVTISTDNTTGGGAVDGSIDFASTIDGVSDSTDDNLILLTGDVGTGGTLTLSGVIGGNVALTSLDINQTAGDIAMSIPGIGGASAGVTGATRIGNTGSGDITFTAGGATAYNFGGALTVTSNGGAGAFQFTGADMTVTAGGAVAFNEGSGTDDTLVLAELKDLTINTSSGNADITLPNVDGSGGDGDDGTDLTLNAGTGTVNLESIDSDINDLQVTGGTINLNGNITTAAFTPTGGSADAAQITLTGDVVLKGGTRTLTSGGGDVTLSAKLDSESGQNRALEIVSGAGAVAINGATGTGVALGNLTINQAGAGAITLSTV